MRDSLESALALLKQSFIGSEGDIWIDEVCKKFSQKSLSLLDIGVGSGESINKKLLQLAKCEYKVQLTGIDPHLSNVELAHNLLSNADLYRIRFEDYVPTKVFDVVNATQSLYYLDNLDESLQKMIKIVNRGGLIILTLWSESCIVYRLHNMIFGDKKRPITAEVASDLLLKSKELRDIKLIRFDGWVNLAKWKDSPEMLNAALIVISRQSKGFHITKSAKQKLLECISERPPLDIRTNILIFATK